MIFHAVTMLLLCLLLPLVAIWVVNPIVQELFGNAKDGHLHECADDDGDHACLHFHCAGRHVFYQPAGPTESLCRSI